MKTFTIAAIAVAAVVTAGAIGGKAVTHIIGVQDAAAGEFVMAGGEHRGGRHERRAMRGMMRDLIRQADANGDRALTQAEIDAFVAEKVALGDANGDGALTLDEFRVVFADVMNRRIVDAFQRQDEDGDGVISAAEIDERFGSIVERMDRNDDGQLDRSDRRGRWERDRG